MKKSKPSEIEDDVQFDDLIDNNPMMTLHNRVESYERERKISWMYTSLEQGRESTENPFEGGANDIPIAQMCRSMEIELKEFLGETDLPSQLLPQNNIIL